MTRREEWLRIVAAMLSNGKNGDYARLTADEMLAEADDRWPREDEWTVSGVPTSSTGYEGKR